jgi:aryl-alcohol dehydrogenase-like predicted oxidoreductase
MSIQPRPLGRTGKRIYPIGFGAMSLSQDRRPEEKIAIAVIHAALRGGVTFIDTADSYCLNDAEAHHNERLIAKALKLHPLGKNVTVATKGGYSRPRGTWLLDAHPEKLRRACEGSLAALGTDSITLYQLHHPDPNVPLADSVGALARLKEEGKIKHIGLSNVTLGQLVEAQKIVRIDSVQNRSNPFAKDDLRNGLVAACFQQGVTYIAHDAVGGHNGHLQKFRHVVLASIGAAHGVSPYQVALAWLLAQEPHIVPIPGASKEASITDSADAAKLELSEMELRQIDEVAA